MVWIIIGAFILDYFFSEPKRFHPLIGFGRWASWIENKLCSPSVLCGGLAWALAVLPWVILACVASYFFQDSSLVYGIFSVFILYLAIGWQSLVSHAKAIQTPLEQKNLMAARVAVSMIVSRNTSTMTDNEIAIATTESVLENGADAVFSAVFWFMVLGVPGVVLYRLSNTLDAMWGYKNEKYLYFGKVAALLDDALNFIPARITACLYALANLNRPSFSRAINCWRNQSKACSSPNGGPVMCAGAGAINATLGGKVIYHGVVQEKPAMGVEHSPLSNSEMISKACNLLNRSVMLMLAVLISLSLMPM